MSSVATGAFVPDRTGTTEATQEIACASGCTGLRAESAEPVLVAAQRRWSARPLGERLQVLRGARHRIAASSLGFARAIAPTLHRSEAETLVTEVLPLLDAIRFLERRAQSVLAPRRPGLRGRPLWLAGIRAEVQRVALGHVLIIAPSNYPVFLAGVQAAQALAAGNAVTWKPGAGGERVARLFAHALHEAGLPRGVLCITDDSTEAAQRALSQGADKVIFTGSLETGKTVLRTLADTATPAVLELSGADAVVVLPSADLPLAARAIAFGLRLNGAAVCMSPRRLVATAETLHALRPLLAQELSKVPAVALRPETSARLRALVADAEERGARMVGEIAPEAQRPLLLERASAEMAIARADIFAPVLSLIEAPSLLHIPEIVNNNPFALTAAVFGRGREARAVGEQLRTGTVLVNDLIAPTVDPRVPFGGVRSSGFGATRGAEGLLEMTSARTMLTRGKGQSRQYQAVGSGEVSLFAALIGLLHGNSLRGRIRALRTLVGAGRGH